MKHVNCLVIFAICFNYSALAQIKINFKGDGLNSKLKLQLYEGGTCAQAKMEGVEGKSSVDLNVGLAIGATDLFLTGLGKIILDDASINPSDILSFTPQFNCSYHILNVHGQINSYMYNSFYDKVLVKTVSGDVSYDDKIQVYSPVATTLELPFEASASVVAVQTFCNPDGSKATARAELTVTCGNQSATAGGTAEVIGAFLDNQYPNDKEKVQVSVPAGVSTFPLHITGTLFTESAVQGLSPLNVILCGSNAVASAGNSLTVKYFTGLNGAPLPQGIKINGLITGVDYLNPQQSSNCLKFPVPDIKVTDASCGNANGMATITISGVGQPQFEWDNGKTGATATGFAAGAHYVIVRDSNGCSATYPFEVHDPYRPSVLLPVDLQLATGQTATLNAADTTGGQYNYAWSTGAATPAITVNTPGIYTVTLTNSAGCLFIYQTLVVDKPGYYFSDGDITTDLSLFFDDGGPNKNYSPNQSNVIKICPATVGKFAVLEFTEVDILNTNDQDELSVFDGTGSICPLNSNVTSPGIYTASVSSGGCLTVRFRATDFDAEGKGWKALIKTTDTPPAGCFRQIQTCSGVLEDSGGAGNPYTAQEYQIYTICPPEPNDNPHFITLDFSEVEIGAGDHLAIYDGKGVNCILEDSLTLPRKFTASNRSGGCLTVVFDSDTSAPAQGWHANISCSPEPVTPPEYCNCGINPIPGNTCDEAPVFNNLEAFCGESSIYYTANVTGNLKTVFTCGIIHNNSFLRFIPNSSSIKLAYKSRGGTHKLCSGFQLAVLRVSGDCTASNAVWTLVKCLNIDNGLSSDGIFQVTGLIAGQTYYLMIDGSYGSECLYSLIPVSGFATCPLNIGYETVSCQPDGSYWVTIPVSGKANGKSYRVYERNNYYGEVKDTAFVDNGTQLSVNIGPYAAGRTYNIIIEGGQGLDSCNINLSGAADCPGACNLDVQIDIACVEQTGEVTFVGKILNAVNPISIVSDLYQTVLFPNEGNSFTFKINGNTEPFTRSIHVTDFNGCSIQRDITVPVCLNCSKELVLFPNPAHDLLHFTPYECTVLSPALYDMSGRWLGTREPQYNNADGAFSIDINDLPAGIYFLQLKSDQTAVTKKFAKF